MKTKLRILLLEDNDVDARLIRHELKTSGFDFHLERIQSEAELRHEMEAAAPDLILSDHGLPSFDGFKALEIVRDKHPELPFIFVSGSNDQGMVERMYDAGATDYVFKDDIRDLAPAVREALAPPSEPAGAEGQPVEALAVVVPGGQLHFCPSCRPSLRCLWYRGGRPGVLPESR